MVDRAPGMRAPMVWWEVAPRGRDVGGAVGPGVGVGPGGVLEGSQYLLKL